MANNVGEWSATAASNTSLGAVSLQENIMLVNAVNNAFRELMAQVATGISSGAFLDAYTPASASAAASLQFPEDTDNGSHKVTLSAPAALSGDIAVTLPSSAGTLAIVAGTIGAVRVQTFTSSGTYTPHANMVYCVIECTGGGAGGGGVAGNASYSLGAGGGGAGGYSWLLSNAATIGASQTVTIGAAGAGGTAGANNGSAGGDTSVGSLCIAKGGSGGGAVGTAAFGLAGAGGVVTGGAGGLIIPGENGEAGGNFNVTTYTRSSGTGGNTRWGAGGLSVLVATNAAVAGNAGGGYGAGCSGAGALATANTAAGGAGVAGLVVVTEYCSQ